MLFVMPFLLAMVVTMAWLPVFGRFADEMARRRSARRAQSAFDADSADRRRGHGHRRPGFRAHRHPVGTLGSIFSDCSRGLAVFGALDDRFDLDYRIKLAGQLMAAAIVVFGGNVQIHALTLDDRVLLPEWISVPLSLFFVIGITNAINLADGLDGLAGGTTFLCLCAARHARLQQRTSVELPRWRWPSPARSGILAIQHLSGERIHGRCGSQLLGFAVGVLSLRATQSSNSVVSAATPILLLALPILDTLSVMVQRISEGRSPFSADKNHIHHKLLALGFDHHEAVMVIYAIQADLFLLAYWMRFESDLAILGVVTGFFLGSITLLQFATRRHWRFRAAKGAAVDSSLTRLISTLRGPRYLPRWSYLAVAIAASAYATLVTVETARLSMDVRLLVMALFAVSIVWFAILRGKPLSTIEKAALYVTATVLVYLDSVIVHDHGAVTIFTWAALITVALGTVLRLRLASKDRRFELSPLDLLVLFVALVVPSLPGSFGLPDGGALGIAKLVILFYAIEVLVSRVELRVVWLRTAAAMLLAGLIVRSLL